MKKGCLGCLGVIAVIFVFGLIVAAIGGHNNSDAGSSGHTDRPTRNLALWNRKALSSESAASNTVGGFTDDDKRLYHLGLQHIYNEHQKLGAFTIAQVVDGESSREKERQQVADEEQRRERDAADAAKRAIEAHLIHGQPDCLVVDDRTLTTSSTEYAWYVVGKVRNTCDRDFGYAQVEVSFFDSDGNLSQSGLANVNNLEAGQTWAFKVLATENGGKWRFKGVSGF